jgi:O-antigen ligase
MMVRHGVHFALYGIFLIYLYELATRKFTQHTFYKAIPAFLSLSCIFLATGAQQIINQDLNINAFDGPSRLLIAGFVLLYLSQKNINYVRLIEIAIPLSLIVLLPYLQIFSNYHWGHRWANIFVDPNSLGSQSTILGMICLLTIHAHERHLVNFLKIIGALCGFYIAIKSESRGGWSTIPFMVICWLVIQYHKDRSIDKIQTVITIATLFLITTTSLLIIVFNSTVNSRLTHTIYEITTWLNDPVIYSSAGSRMSMWVVSFDLIKENIWGYGELAIKDFSLNHPLYSSIHKNGFIDLVSAGPHSDILSKGLSLGIIGIVAYLLTILIPAGIFFKKINSPNKNVQKSAEIGLIYITGIFVAGLFNETLSLKYLCTFYGLMIACLIGQVLYNQNADNTTPI